jgi:uncharacterized protein involved in type VI secretion and phage assembly
MTVGARPMILVGSSPISTQLEGAVRRLEVRTDRLGPDSCQLVLEDPTRDVLKRAGIDLQAKLTVKAGRVGAATGDQVFYGSVYSLQFDFDELGSRSTVIAYDCSYRLYNGLHTATYQNLTDSDLAEQIAGEVGLDVGTIDPTDVVHKHITQMNETYFDLLARRGREVNRVLMVRSNKLNFTEPTDAADGPAPGDFDSRGPLQLVPGHNVERLTTRITAAGQVMEVECRGWDPQTKQAVSATATSRSTAAKLPDQPDQVAAKFDSPRHVTVKLPVATQAECDALAASYAEQLASGFMYAEGMAEGNPRIMAGVAVSLGQTGGGGRFDGQVTVSQAKHIWNKSGYHTWFVASGGHDRSLRGLLGGTPQAGAQLGGVVIGVVTNVSDEDDQGRVKVSFPWLQDDHETDWARVLQLGAGSNDKGGYGLRLLPQVGSEVLVGFELGDPRRPVVIGSLYNGVDNPPFGNAVDKNAGTVIVTGLRTPAGHQLKFTDTPGKETIELSTKDKNVSIVMNAASGGLSIDTGGDATIHIRGNANITADKNFTIEAPKGSGKITAKNGLTLEGGTGVTVRGDSIALNP